MAKIYEGSLSTIMAQGKFFFYYFTFDLLWLFHIRCFVSSSERKNQIVDTIGTLLHHILGEFYRRMPCLLSTVFVTYILEIGEEA